MDSIRVVMSESKQLPSGGGQMQLGAGSFYLLPAKLAQALIEEGVAYLEGEPPVTSDGTVFEGAGAHQKMAAHEAKLAAAEEEEAGKLAAVEFASESARELAADNDLSAADFDFEPSGATGFTVADVRGLLGERES